MKKLLLSLGSVAAIVAPVAAVVACGDDNKAAFTLKSELDSNKNLTVTVTGKDVKIDDLAKEINAKADTATAKVQFKVEATTADLFAIPAADVKDLTKVTAAIKANVKYAGVLGKILLAADRNLLADKPTAITATAKATATIDATKATDAAKALVEAKKWTIANFDVKAGATALTATEVKLAPVVAANVDFAAKKVTFTIELITDATIKANVEVSFGTTAPNPNPNPNPSGNGQQSKITSITADFKGTAPEAKDAANIAKTDFEVKDQDGNVIDATKWDLTQPTVGATDADASYTITLIADTTISTTQKVTFKTAAAPQAPAIKAITATFKDVTKVPKFDTDVATTQPLVDAIKEGDFEVKDDASTPNVLQASEYTVTAPTLAAGAKQGDKIKYTIALQSDPSVKVEVEVTLA